MGSARTTPITTSAPALGDQELADLAKQLLAYAHRYAGSAGLCKDGVKGMMNAQTIEDLVSDCIITLIDPESKRQWNHVTEPNPLKYLISVFNSKLSHAKGRAQRHHEFSEADEPSLLGSPSTSPEACLLELERRAVGKQAADVLLERIIDDAPLLAMYDAVESGAEKPADIAKLMSVDVQVVYNLSKRLDRLYEKVAAQVRTELQLDGGSDG